MIRDLIDVPLAFVLSPLAGVAVVRRIWSRKRQDDASLREERANAARREAMRAMYHAMAAAERAQRSREEFLARMSHELRTPLNAVIGFSRVLESNRAGNQRPEDIRLLARVRAGGEQLLSMIDDVLEQSRIARGQLTIECAATDVRAIASSVLADHAGAAERKGITLSSDLSPTIATVEVDPGRFEQVLDHLVDNAIKFTPGAGGRVAVEIRADDRTGRPERVIVTDNGIGIPVHRLEEIFEPFEQVDSGPGRSYDGAGLGLPIARQLCRAMGCELTVDSQPGLGSRFTIHFPDSP